MQLYALYLMVMLYIFQASLAHHQEFKETVFAAKCLIQLFSILSFVCHVLYLCQFSVGPGLVCDGCPLGSVRHLLFTLC